MPNDRASDDGAPLDFDALAVLHLDGLLDGAQHADFTRQLAGDPAKAARLAALAELHATLIELGRTTLTQAAQARSPGSISIRHHRRSRRSDAVRMGTPRLQPWGLAAAAVLAVGIITALLVPWSSPAQDLLTVERGAVVVERQGQRLRVGSDASGGALALLPGDQLAVAAGAVARIGSMRGDRLALAGGSRLAWSTEQSALRLEAGELSAEITPRTSERPFILATPRADLVVVGTRFTVQADEGLSLLAVDHGRVRLANREDQRQVEVAAHQLVVTSGLGELVASSGDLPVATSATGLTGDYFAHQDFTAWRFRRVDSAIDFDWGPRGPGGQGAARVPGERFSVRWRGWLVPAYSGTYTFTFLMDDGVRLWLDGRLVLDEWHLSEKLEFSTTVALTANQPYALRLDFYQQPRDAVISWRWSLPGYPKQVIPTAWLRPLEWSPPDPARP